MKRLYVLALIHTSHMAVHFTSDRTHKSIYSPIQKFGDDYIFYVFERGLLLTKVTFICSKLHKNNVVKYYYNFKMSKYF